MRSRVNYADQMPFPVVDAVSGECRFKRSGVLEIRL